MSAIFGILRFDGGAASRLDLERMGDMLAHRGPDRCKIISDGPVGLGHRLMRVNQEDRFEAQPVYDPDANLIVVADLRLDNREELAKTFDISEADLRDLPDSALVLRAYKTWGEDCATHLLGDFAFALWDGRAKKLVLTRDHMGQRSLHYHRGENFLAFATEIKALWALPDVPRRLNDAQIGRLMLWDRRHRPGVTLFDKIAAVSSASTVTVSALGALADKRYWEPHADPAHLDQDERYYIDAYRRIFTEAVECRIRRLIAPPALSLSGGYDSGAIAGLCGPVLTAKGRKLIGVSSVLPEDYQGPLLSARRWVALCQRDMPHLEVRYFVRGAQTLFTHLERTFMAADGLPPLPHYVADALYREASSAGARLIMDGYAGDETLNPRGGGALAYFLRTGQFRRFIAEFRAHLRLPGKTLRGTLRGDIIARLTPPWAKRAWRAVRRGFAPVWFDKAIAPSFARRLIKTGEVKIADILGAAWDNPGPRGTLLLSLAAWGARYRRNETNEAAARGLDLTRPLADKRVVEFGLALPEALYVKDGRNRYLARRALADIYPAEFQTRPGTQDLLDPDPAGMLRAAQPQLIAEIERMASSPTLQRYVDFEKLKTALILADGEQGFDAKRAYALRTFYAARYMAWFCGENGSTVSDLG